MFISSDLTKSEVVSILVMSYIHLGQQWEEAKTAVFSLTVVYSFPHIEVIKVSLMLQFFSPQMQLLHLGTKFIVTSACFLNTGQLKSSMPSTAAVEELI